MLVRFDLAFGNTTVLVDMVSNRLSSISQSKKSVEFIFHFRAVPVRPHPLIGIGTSLIFLNECIVDSINAWRIMDNSRREQSNV